MWKNLTWLHHLQIYVLTRASVRLWHEIAAHFPKCFRLTLSNIAKSEASHTRKYLRWVAELRDWKSSKIIIIIAMSHNLVIFKRKKRMWKRFHHQVAASKWWKYFEFIIADMWMTSTVALRRTYFVALWKLTEILSSLNSRIYCSLFPPFFCAMKYEF